MRNVFVTGPIGFIGTHLIRTLEKTKKFKVIPFEGDLLSAKDLRSCLSRQPVHHTVHLAGISHPLDCDKDPSRAFQINVAGTQLLAELVSEFAPNSSLFFFSTAQVYKIQDNDLGDYAIDEKHEVEPQNIYARSKYAAELILRSVYAKKLKVRILRLFNHTHMSQPPNAFLPRVYQELLKAPKNQKLILKLGNVDLFRDFSSIPSLLKKVEALLENEEKFQSEFEIYNISSGYGLNLRDLTLALAARMGVDLQIELDPSRVRSGEPRCVVGNSKKINDYLKIHVFEKEQYTQHFLDQFMANPEK